MRNIDTLDQRSLQRRWDIWNRKLDRNSGHSEAHGADGYTGTLMRDHCFRCLILGQLARIEEVMDRLQADRLREEQLREAK